jgi:hypothetical protein
MRPHNLNGGRPKFVPTKEQQSDVRALASCGNSQAVIANYLHISINTLKLHFAEELSAAAIKANQAVAINLFRIATRGTGAAAVSAIKYWLNSRAKDVWGASVRLDLAVDGGGISGLLKRVCGAAAKQDWADVENTAESTNETGSGNSETEFGDDTDARLDKD